MGDRVLGPYRQGQEVELPLWIATHFVRMGYAKFKDEDQLTPRSLSTFQFKETLQARQPSKLPRNFYFQLRRLLKDLRVQELKDRSIAKDLDKARALGRDIADARVKKIVSLAASGEHTIDLTANLTVEEQVLYEDIRKRVESWKKDILGREKDS